ncbi:MAG: hypothetical protein JW840_10560 [Candidatus Thermoplasmatota archaeon]|nr:hypothetical protein [Candidatus Thermoplasmatota archaeon]
MLAVGYSACEHCFLPVIEKRTTIEEKPARIKQAQALFLKREKAKTFQFVTVKKRTKETNLY